MHNREAILIIIGDKKNNPCLCARHVNDAALMCPAYGVFIGDLMHVV